MCSMQKTVRFVSKTYNNLPEYAQCNMQQNVDR